MQHSGSKPAHLGQQRRPVITGHRFGQQPLGAGGPEMTGDDPPDGDLLLVRPLLGWMGRPGGAKEPRDLVGLR